jgi:uncharacterized membrane protein
MIQSTSNLDGYNRADAALLAQAKQTSAPKSSPADLGGERLSVANTQALREALNNAPEIRPEVVERAKNLAVDPNYPPRELIERLAKLMVETRDTAE